MSPTETNTHQKLKELEAVVKVPDYSKDKNGWVSFNVNKPKKKLRKYISGLAQVLCSRNKQTYKTNRETLIKYYNQDGLDGIRRVMFINLIEKRNG